MQKDKYKILQCLESAHLKNIITQDYKDAQIHILSMAHLNQQVMKIIFYNVVKHAVMTLRAYFLFPDKIFQ